MAEVAVLDTTKETSPSGSENVIVGEVVRSEKPPIATDHEVPDVSPTSVKLTRESCAAVQITLTVPA